MKGYKTGELGVLASTIIRLLGPAGSVDGGLLTMAKMPEPRARGWTT
jgi:hypothetical protein